MKKIFKFIPTAYRITNVIVNIFGALLAFFGLLGVVIFVQDDTMRVTQLASIITSILGGLALLVPVHKLKNNPWSKVILFSLVITFSLTTGLWEYPVYIMAMIFLSFRLFTLMLKIFSQLQGQSQKAKIGWIVLWSMIIAACSIIVFNYIFSWLDAKYGRITMEPISTTLSTTQDSPPPKVPVNIADGIPGSPTRIWQIEDQSQLIVETMVAGERGKYPTLYLLADGKPKLLAKASAAKFRDSVSIGKFASPYLSPDKKYLFIVESGYEGGMTHAFKIATGEPLNRDNFPGLPGLSYWSPNGRCIVAEQYEYGDRQSLQLGQDNEDGYNMYPYDQSIIVAMGLKVLSIGWIDESNCKIYVSFNAGMFVNPVIDGIDVSREFLYDLATGPVIRGRWDALSGLKAVVSSIPLEQVYP